MQRLFRYIKGYEKETVLAPLFKMLEACFELLVPIVMARIVDVKASETADLPFIWRQCALLVLLAAVGHGLQPDGTVLCRQGGAGVRHGAAP